MSEQHWALKAPSGYLLPTKWRRTDAIEEAFQLWGGEGAQGLRQNWWRRMKRNGWSIVKVTVTEGEANDE